VPEDQPLADLSHTALNAVIATLQGKPHDVQFDCNVKTDLRSTSPDEITEFKKLGPTPDFMMTAMAIHLWGPTGDQGQAVSGDTALLLFRDGKVKWAPQLEVNSDKGHGLPLDQTPDAFKSSLTRLIATLAPVTCKPNIAQIGDFATMPLPPDVLDSLNSFTSTLPDPHTVCSVVAHEDGPWKVHLDQMYAIGFGNGNMGTVKTDIKFDGQRVCLGAANIEVGSLKPDKHDESDSDDDSSTPPPPPSGN
jgi:hypothetical protein